MRIFKVGYILPYLKHARTMPGQYFNRQIEPTPPLQYFTPP